MQGLIERSAAKPSNKLHDLRAKSKLKTRAIIFAAWMRHCRPTIFVALLCCFIIVHCGTAALQYFLQCMRHCCVAIHCAALPLYSIYCISMLQIYSSLLHCHSAVFLAVRAALPLCYTLRGIAALQYVLHCSIADLQYSLLCILAGVWLQ